MEEERINNNQETDGIDNSQIDQLQQLQKSLNYERSRRKEAEKKLANYEDDYQAEIKKAEDEMRATLKAGKSEFNDDVIEDMMNAFGKKQAAAQVNQARQNVEQALMELRRKYRDVDNYASDIKELIKQGLTPERAYWACVGEEFYSNFQKDDGSKSKELNKERMQQGFPETVPTAGEKKPTYTSRERAIAENLGKSVEEVRERSKSSFFLEDILKMNNKFERKG